MDVLSEVLRVVRLSGVVHFSAEFTHPWAIISTSPDVLAKRLMPGAQAITLMHLAVTGALDICTDTPRPIRIEAGDVIIFPRGDQHVMTSQPGLPPVPIGEILPNPSADRIQHMTHGGGGAACRLICGYLHSDQRFDPLLEALPRMLVVRLRRGVVTLESVPADGSTVGPSIPGDVARWWETTLQYTFSEATTPRPGNRAVLGRLTELLFMEVLRWYIQDLTVGHRGWVAGLNDPHVGPALRLLHTEPERPWTVEGLARAVAISRSALAKRFVDLVGESPMHYLTGWRIHLAKRLLRDSTLSIGEIAGRVGYESEPAFHRAFRRLVGRPAAAWRRRGDS